MKITIRNNFHSTVQELDLEPGDVLDPETVAAIKLRMCHGDTTCGCSGRSPLGHRGPQDQSHYFSVEIDGSVTYDGPVHPGRSPAEERMDALREAEGVNVTEAPVEDDWVGGLWRDDEVE
jgi:hypothetical protein